MPNLNGRFTKVVEGDSLSIERTMNRRGGGYPDVQIADGVTLTRAWLTFKTAENGVADPGTVQKIITTADVPGVGHIENDGASDADPVLRFDMAAADTTALVAGTKD